MIIVKVYEEQSKIVAIDACGRADASRGGALIESAIAAILNTLVMGLEQLRRIGLELSEGEGDMHISIRRGRSRGDVQALMRAARLALQQQSKLHPFQVRVVERKIFSGGVVL